MASSGTSKTSEYGASYECVSQRALPLPAVLRATTWIRQMCGSRKKESDSPVPGPGEEDWGSSVISLRVVGFVRFVLTILTCITLLLLGTGSVGWVFPDIVTTTWGLTHSHAASIAISRARDGLGCPFLFLLTRSLVC